MGGAAGEGLAEGPAREAAAGRGDRPRPAWAPSGEAVPGEPECREGRLSGERAEKRRMEDVSCLSRGYGNVGGVPVWFFRRDPWAVRLAEPFR